jgi:hypothetical protein
MTNNRLTHKTLLSLRQLFDANRSVAYLKMVAFLLLLLFNNGSFAQTRADSMLIQIIDEDSITPVAGAAIRLSNKGKEPLRLITNERGEACVPTTYKADSIQITYWGKTMLHAAAQLTLSINRFYIQSNLYLDNVTITANRQLVKRSLMQDVVQIKGIELFKSDNALDILPLIPGVVIDENRLSYFNHPIIGIRLGKGGVLKGIGASTMKILKALRTENINDITFKRRNQGQGIQYEIIIKTDHSVDVTLSPTLGAYMGKRANAEASLYSQLSTKHLNNILMVSGDVLNKRKSEQSTYDIHSKQTQVDVDDAEHGKSLNLNYDAEWSPNDAFSAGISTSYYTNRGQKSRISHEESASFHFEYAPMTFEDVTGSLFLNWNKGCHSLHGEMSYNKSISRINLKTDGVTQQDLHQNSISPNAFVEYALTNKAQTAGLSASFAYAHLRNTDTDKLVSTPQLPIKEHTFTPVIAVFWEKDKFGVHAAMQFERNYNNFYSSFALLPKLSLRYGGDAMSVELDYAKSIDRPLAFMLTNNQTTQTSKFRSVGNARLIPSDKQQLDINLSWSNLFFTISKRWENNVKDLLLDDTAFGDTLLERWQNVGRASSWDFNVYYNLHYGWFYANPHVSLNLGKFKGNANHLNNYNFTLSLPLQATFNNHKLSVDIEYLAHSKYYQTTTQPMLILDIRYNVNIPKSHIIITFFARDLLNSMSIEKSTTQTASYLSSTVLHKDKRLFGLSLAYSFSKGKQRNINGVTNNQNRNK